MKDIMTALKGGLIVSCQALPDEPLHSSYIMSRMAVAAYEGGACGIRANTVADITEIKKAVPLPIIGIIKTVYPECPVFITPTSKEVCELVECGCDIIAIDATMRSRPDGLSLDETFKPLRERFPNQLFMADCSTYEEGMHAAELGFDFIGTTLCGYTNYTKGVTLPACNLMRQLVRDCSKPVVAEGGIWTTEQLRSVYETGVFTVVMGTAITRPRDITRRFVNEIKGAVS